MDYKTIYKDLCESRQSLDRQKHGQTYYELHHILPRCLGGTDSKDNLVLLTAREHYIAHWLLYKMHSGDAKQKMAHAWFSICNFYNFKQQRTYTSGQYEKAKKAHALSMQINNPMQDGHTEEAKNKMRKAKLGKPISEKAKLARKGKPSNRRISAIWERQAEIYQAWKINGKCGSFKLGKILGIKETSLRHIINKFKQGE